MVSFYLAYVSEVSEAKTLPISRDEEGEALGDGDKNREDRQPLLDYVVLALLRTMLPDRKASPTHRYYHQSKIIATNLWMATLSSFFPSLFGVLGMITTLMLMR